MESLKGIFILAEAYRITLMRSHYHDYDRDDDMTSLRTLTET